MDLTSINAALNAVNSKITNYLDKPAKFDFAPYEKQLDTIFISNCYNNIVNEYSNVLNIITEAQYFISQCKKAIRLIGDSNALAKQQKAQVKTAIDIIEEQLVPLYNEKERLKTIEMFYRNIYTRRDF
jgi:hypothetical protein